MHREPVPASSAPVAGAPTGLPRAVWRTMAALLVVALVGTLVTTGDLGSLRGLVSPLSSTGMLLIALTHGWPRADGRRRPGVEVAAMTLAILGLLALVAHLLTR